MKINMSKTLADASLEELIATAAEKGARVKPEERPVWLLTLTELIQELGGRAFAMVVGITVADEKDSWTNKIVMTGNSAVCVGLADAAVENARQRMYDRTIVADDSGNEDDGDDDQVEAGAD